MRNKYLFIFRTTFMESLQYVMNIILGFFTFFLVIFVFAQVWNYIYGDSTKLIEGYTKGEMIWYLILTEIMWYGNKNATLLNQISEDIKSGSIAYGLNKPYHYILYVIAKHFGEMVLRLVLYIIIGCLIGVASAGALLDFQADKLPLMVIVFILGLLINAAARITISIISFWIEDSTPFHWIYDKMILVFGTFFPIDVFPAWLQPIFKYSPIFVVTYGPARLIIHFSMSLFWQVLLLQLLYLVISWGLMFLLYQKGVKRVNVNGG